MSYTMQNGNYRIATDTMPHGKVRARAHGRKTTTRTFPEGTTHELAAMELAKIIEGERFAHVGQHSGHATSADWAVYVTIGA